MFKKYILEPYLVRAASFPSRNAFCISGVYFTYTDLIQKTASIARALNDNSQVQIGLVANDDLATYASILAIWFTGKSFVPLNPTSPAARNKNIIDQVGLTTILNSNKACEQIIEDFDSSVQFLQQLLTDAELDNQLAYIFFTSGSTGIPKGVMISKKNVASFIEAFEALGYNIDETDRCLQMFDLTFDLSVMSFLVPLLKGACVYTVPKDKVKYGYIFELMEEKELTVALMVPSILNYLRPYFPEICCPKMKYSLFCGEALAVDIVEEWAKCLPNARIDNVYGPTENTIFCTCYTFKREGGNSALNGIMSIGKPMLNNLAVVFNYNNKPAQNDEIGELCLGGSQLTSGYFKNSELNMDLFFSTEYHGILTRFYRTGDLCVNKVDGNLAYSGRKDFQVKIQGFRIELSEIEFYAKKITLYNYNVLALAIKNNLNNFEIALVFEAKEFDYSVLKENLSSALPSYMVPTQYYFIKSFPLNVNGKIDRNVLYNILNITY